MTTWITLPRSAVRFTHGKPAVYASSPGVRRGFCPTCGSPLYYENEKSPDEIDLFAALLRDPAALDPRPSRHVFVAEQVPWFEVHDQLPRFTTTSRGGAAPARVGPR